MTDQSTLAKRLDATTWGLLLLMTGVLMVLPGDLVPQGAWLILAGVILLGMSLARYMAKLPISVLVITLGVLGVAAGMFSAAGMHFPLLAAFLILIGASLMLHTWLVHGEA